MVCVKALGTDLLLTLEAIQNEILHVIFALVFHFIKHFGPYNFTSKLFLLTWFSLRRVDYFLIALEPSLEWWSDLLLYVVFCTGWLLYIYRESQIDIVQVNFVVNLVLLVWHVDWGVLLILERTIIVLTWTKGIRVIKHLARVCSETWCNALPLYLLRQSLTGIGIWVCRNLWCIACLKAFRPSRLLSDSLISMLVILRLLLISTLMLWNAWHLLLLLEQLDLLNLVLLLLVYIWLV